MRSSRSPLPSIHFYMSFFATSFIDLLSTPYERSMYILYRRSYHAQVHSRLTSTSHSVTRCPSDIAHNLHTNRSLSSAQSSQSHDGSERSANERKASTPPTTSSDKSFAFVLSVKSLLHIYSMDCNHRLFCSDFPKSSGPNLTHTPYAAFVESSSMTDT